MSAQPAADLVLYNGNVITLSQPALARAVAVREGRIVGVGRTEDVLNGAGAQTHRIDLGGRTLIPGLNDAHAHVWKIGQLLTTMLDLRRVGSIDELVARVRAHGLGLPHGVWLLGRGYNEAAMRERRMPTRADLDRADSTRPIVLTRTCGHICAVNSAALSGGRIDAATDAPEGGVIDRDDRGEPTGVLRETAIGLITRAMPAPGRGEYERMIVAALDHQLSLGITSSSDCGVRPELIDVYRAMDAQGALGSRVNVMPLRRVDGVPSAVPLPERFVSDRLRVDTVKFLADGGLSGATAALSVPYRHTDSRGVLRFADAELLELCAESHRAGWRIATHAIGDVAIDQVLDIYERLGAHPRRIAHRIEHFGLPDASQLARAKALGVIAAPQPIFIRAFGRNFRQYLPDALLARAYPIRAMIDARIPVALSSDAPVVEDDNPLAGMTAAVTRIDGDGELIAPSQAITTREALYGYTMGGAVATGDEANRGSIAVGKWADFAVLSGNPLAESPEALTRLTIDMTLVAGRVAFER